MLVVYILIIGLLLLSLVHDGYVPDIVVSALLLDIPDCAGRRDQEPRSQSDCSGPACTGAASCHYVVYAAGK